MLKPRVAGGGACSGSAWEPIFVFRKPPAPSKAAAAEEEHLVEGDALSELLGEW